jgi:hypothetical protein
MTLSSPHPLIQSVMVADGVDRYGLELMLEKVTSSLQFRRGSGPTAPAITHKALSVSTVPVLCFGCMLSTIPMLIDAGADIVTSFNGVLSGS